MRSYLEFIQEDTAAQRLYKKKGLFKGLYGPFQHGEEKLIDYVENKEKAPYQKFLEKYRYEIDNKGKLTGNDYKDAEDIYISYRKYNEIGINPQSPYDTPNGIYTYPIKQMWERIETNSVPFASEEDKSPFIYVIKAKPEYSWSTAQNKDTKILTVHFDNVERISKRFAEYMVNKCSFNQIEKTLDLVGYFVENRLRKDPYGYAATVDYSDIKNASINTQELNYTSFFELIKTENFNKSNAITMLDKLLIKSFNKCKQNGYNCFLLVWYVSRELAINEEGIKTDIIYDKYDYESNDRKVVRIPKLVRNKWNFILSKVLGFEVCINKNDEGYIYPAEKTQAVFLNSSTFDVIDVLDNKPRMFYADHKRTGELIKTQIERINNFNEWFKKELGDGLLTATKLCKLFEIDFSADEEEEQVLLNLNEITTKRISYFCRPSYSYTKMHEGLSFAQVNYIQYLMGKTRQNYIDTEDREKLIHSVDFYTTIFKNVDDVSVVLNYIKFVNKSFSNLVVSNESHKLYLTFLNCVFDGTSTIKDSNLVYDVPDSSLFKFRTCVLDNCNFRIQEKTCRIDSDTNLTIKNTGLETMNQKTWSHLDFPVRIIVNPLLPFNFKVVNSRCKSRLCFEVSFKTYDEFIKCFSFVNKTTKGFSKTSVGSVDVKINGAKLLTCTISWEDLSKIINISEEDFNAAVGTKRPIRKAQFMKLLKLIEN